MRLPLTAAFLAGTALVLAGCGDDIENEPDLRIIEDGLELRTLTLPDGREIECVLFTDDGAYTSWTAFDCNWDVSIPPLNG